MGADGSRCGGAGGLCSGAPSRATSRSPLRTTAARDASGQMRSLRSLTRPLLGPCEGRRRVRSPRTSAGCGRRRPCLTTPGRSDGGAVGVSGRASRRGSRSGAVALRHVHAGPGEARLKSGLRPGCAVAGWGPGDWSPGGAWGGAPRSWCCLPGRSGNAADGPPYSYLPNSLQALYIAATFSTGVPGARLLPSRSTKRPPSVTPVPRIRRTSSRMA